MWAVLAAMAVSGDAAACAGFVHEAGELAESAWQEALFERIEGGVRVEYEVDLVVDTADFGWIIPIPGAFIAVSDGEVGSFDALFEATGPELDLEYEQSQGCALAANDAALKGGFDSASASEDANSVREVYSGGTPTYEVTVLEADSAAALDGWLGEHGWEAGAVSGSVAEYAAEGGWQFVAVSLRIDAVEGESDLGLPPIRLDYGGERMVFPSRMGRYADTDRQRTMVYVRGDQRARVSEGWGQVDLAEIRDEGEDPDYMQYDAYPEAIQAAGNDGQWALTWAGELDGAWVSRFELDAPSSLHTVDAGFALDAGEEPLQLVISNRAAGGCRGDGAWLLLPAVAGMLARRGATRRGR